MLFPSSADVLRPFVCLAELLLLIAFEMYRFAADSYCSNYLWILPAFPIHERMYSERAVKKMFSMYKNMYLRDYSFKYKCTA